MKIMVVDDEEFSLEKIKKQIGSFSFVTELRGYSNPMLALNDLSNWKPDIAVLDIEMFGLDGIELSIRCKQIYADLKVIFLTAYSEYAIEAFKIRANGYILKPASTKDIEEELLHAKGLKEQPIPPNIWVQTFGNFEVFVDQKPIDFERSKSKELLAYLISRKGAYVNGDELLAVLYEDRPSTTSLKSQLRNVIASLMRSLKAAGIEQIILKKRNQLAVDVTTFSCDYYDFLKGDVDKINSFMGEFMSNYPWADFITGYLENKIKTQN